MSESINISQDFFYVIGVLENSLIGIDMTESKFKGSPRKLCEVDLLKRKLVGLNNFKNFIVPDNRVVVSCNFVKNSRGIYDKCIFSVNHEKFVFEIIDKDGLKYLSVCKYNILSNKICTFNVQYNKTSEYYNGFEDNGIWHDTLEEYCEVVSKHYINFQSKMGYDSMEFDTKYSCLKGYIVGNTLYAIPKILRVSDLFELGKTEDFKLKINTTNNGKNDMICLSVSYNIITRFLDNLRVDS